MFDFVVSNFSFLNDKLNFTNIVSLSNSQVHLELYQRVHLCQDC